MTIELETVKYKAFCWSCGSTHLVKGECPKCQADGESPKVLFLQPPEEPPAFCGGKKKDIKKEFNSQQMRSCCHCGKEWLCDQYTWVHGTCPHCGTTGPLISPKNKVPFDFKSLTTEKITLTPFTGENKKFINQIQKIKLVEPMIVSKETLLRRKTKYFSIQKYWQPS